MDIGWVIGFRAYGPMPLLRSLYKMVAVGALPFRGWHTRADAERYVCSSRHSRVNACGTSWYELAAEDLIKVYAEVNGADCGPRTPDDPRCRVEPRRDPPGRDRLVRSTNRRRRSDDRTRPRSRVLTESFAAYYAFVLYTYTRRYESTTVYSLHGSVKPYCKFGPRPRAPGRSAEIGDPSTGTVPIRLCTVILADEVLNNTYKLYMKYA